MKRKLLFTFSVLGSLCLNVSCEKDALELNPALSTSLSSKVENSPATLEKKALALYLSELPLTKSNYEEVFNAVNIATEEGLEEAYYFSEILAEAPQRNKIVMAKQIKGKGKSLGQLMKTSSILKEASAKRINSYGAKERKPFIDLERIENSDLQIYWPYSEDWDGHTIPAITFTPEDPNQEWNYAFKKNGEHIDTIIVDEEYMMKHPVWIINNSDNKYEDLPCFSKGENIKNNTFYVRRKNSSNSNAELVNSAPQKVYTVFLGKFMAAHQYDKIWAGGSEFIIQMGAVPHFNIVSVENLSSISPHVATFKINRSRKDIRKRRWIERNDLLIADWHDSSSDATFMIHEEDQGEDKYWETSVPIKLPTGETASFSIKLKHKTHDDMVYRTIISRNFIFSTNNRQDNKWVEHRGGDVYWTFPYKMANTIY
ncbi:MAG: hypothetical protein SOY99_08005 [Alloprevotella sp.]|nr:hypothetical protein [Alloprevotella sp.]